jgi:hypothetical protein
MKRKGKRGRRIKQKHLLFFVSPSYRIEHKIMTPQRKLPDD